MRNSKTAATSHMVGGLFTFALFGLFVVLSLLIVVIGVDGYKSVVDTGDRTNELRTTLGYVVGKLRSEAAADGVSLEEREGVKALVLTQINDENELMETIIYFQDGMLLESYINVDMMDFDPEFGDLLTGIASFSIQETEDGLISLTAATKDGYSQTVRVAPRVAREVTVQ